MSLWEFRKTLNEWGGAGVPFLFMVDFEMQKPLAYRLDSIPAGKILYDVNGIRNSDPVEVAANGIDFIKFPLAFNDYKKKYDKVFARLAYGDSYLANLTIKTKVKSPVPLKDLFDVSRAKYKMLFENQFLFFSPETFVRIQDGRIYAFPMKGTIDASLDNARERILHDRKELAEHVTIVDLLRNDLSEISENVQVSRFRFVDEIKTTKKNLLQISSEIWGDLPQGYEKNLGDILVKLLPAGSVTGAPKCKTLEIIREAEGEPRGYYAGVTGVYDGKILDSGVMIRFIENSEGTLYYRSGGGITTQSTSEAEYQEAIDKVYVPLD
jgi:para-aminobenzoate synthetase component 1